jgi:DNA-binding beta-propeller fold protein YncE
MTSESRLFRSPGVLFLFAILFAAGLLTVVFGGKPSVDRKPVMIGADRIVAREQLAEVNGPMCEFVPASAAQELVARARPAVDPSAPKTRPSKAERDALAKRQPKYIMKDSNPGYAGIAVDPTRNEVILADENMFGIHVFDRTTNTPPRAARSEPKRMIMGEDTSLEFACSVYVDPATGEIYGINNDTLNWMPVFGRDQQGNAKPLRRLATPHTTFGIVADEERQELLITIQDDQAIQVFKKNAKDEEPGTRVIQGPDTMMADPHGITLDTARKKIFVSNWGSRNTRKATDPQREKRVWPIGRNQNNPGSGEWLPASITVYPKDASGNVKPLQTISGPKTQLDWPTALAFHAGRNELFVANDTTHTITVYSGDANGDVAPIRVLTGPKTNIKHPTGVAVDEKNNELWVANFGNHSATVYDIAASGNAEPKRMIRSAPIGTPTPMIGNPHTMAFDTKRNEILVAN